MSTYCTIVDSRCITVQSVLQVTLAHRPTPIHVAHVDRRRASPASAPAPPSIHRLRTPMLATNNSTRPPHSFLSPFSFCEPLSQHGKFPALHVLCVTTHIQEPRLSGGADPYRQARTALRTHLARDLTCRTDRVHGPTILSMTPCLFFHPATKRSAPAHLRNHPRQMPICHAPAANATTPCPDD